MEREQQPMEVVYRSGTRKDCRTRGLVLDAAGIRYEIHGSPGECTLIVAAPDADRARAELDAYARENGDWPADAATLPQCSTVGRRATAGIRIRMPRWS